MKKHTKKILGLFLASAMSLALLTACGGTSDPGGESGSGGSDGGSGDGQVYELSLSTHDPATSNKTIYFQQWADQIKEASDGRLNITIYSAGALASGTAALDALRTNVCDIAWIYPPYFSGQFPLSEVISQPIGVTSVPQGTQVLYGLYEAYPELQEELSEFVPLMMHTNPTNKICSIDGYPIDSVDDLQGLTFRASAGTPSDLLLAWGATPIQMAPGDIYQAVERGTVEGYIFDWSGIVSFGLQEVTANLTTMPVYLGPYFLMMNQNSFNSLPEDLQQILLENSGLDASMGLAWVYEGDEREGREICEAAGCTMIDVTPEAEAEFLSYGEALLEDWIAEYGDRVDAEAYVADARALAEEYAISMDEVYATLDEMGL